MEALRRKAATKHERTTFGRPFSFAGHCYFISRLFLLCVLHSGGGKGLKELGDAFPAGTR
jgi:hypothetical protein